MHEVINKIDSLYVLSWQYGLFGCWLIPGYFDPYITADLGLGIVLLLLIQLEPTYYYTIKNLRK